MWWSNSAALGLWNAPDLDSLLARDWTDMSEATRTRLALCLERVRRGEVVREQWTLYPNGEPVTVSTTLTGIEIDDGRIAILLKGRPEDEAVLDPALVRGVEALRHTRVLIETLNESGHIVYQNPAALKAFGPPERGGFFERFGAPGNADRIRTLLGASEAHSEEYLVATTAGERWHAVDWHPIRDPVTGERLALVQQLDVTERHQMQDALALAMDQARSASLMKSDFIATMSHEIRTPMNGVLGMLDLLNMSSGLSREQQDWVQAAHDSASALLKIIGDILDASKLEAAQIALEEGRFELPALLESLVKLMATGGGDAPQVALTVDPGIDPGRIGDAGRLRQVLLNLLSNAVKFTPNGSVALRLRPAKRGEPWLHFEVEDNGIGIQPEHRARLFEPFVQADASISRRFGGTGLGLAISRQLVELMGGAIDVESPVGTSGTGSRFWFEVPLPSQDHYAEHVSSKPPSASDHLRAKPLRVLVAEDNRINQRVIRAMLERLGHHVVLASDGLEATTRVLDDPTFDLVLMDMQMPTVDGLAATRAIRSQDATHPYVRTLPIVAITANAGGLDRKRCLDAGMNDFLPKPVLVEALAAVIKRTARK